MAMAAEVLHPSASDQKDWDRTARMNYLKALITKLPLAVYNWFVHYQLDHIDDVYFSRMLTTTTYSKYMRLREVKDLSKDKYFSGCKGLNSAHQYASVDYTPIQDVKPYDGMYVAPTVILFTREKPELPWQVMAISIGHLRDEVWQHILLTPSDGNAWTLARYFAIQGGAHIVALTGHPASHFPYDTVNAISQSALPMRHTLFKLLKPHLRLHLAVDHAVLEGGHSIVSESHGEFYAPFVGPSEEVRGLVSAGYIGYPNFLSKYEPSDTPGPAHPRWRYPQGARDVPSGWGTFLSAYYATVKRYVSTVVAHIYARRDTEGGMEELYYIRNWARYIAQWLPGFPDEKEILEDDGSSYPNLITAATTYIWDVAIAHTLEHKTYSAPGPHHTCYRIRVPPPESNKEAKAYARTKILHGWDMFKATLAFEMFFKTHNVETLLEVKYDFDDDALRQAARAFKTDLKETEARLIREGLDVDRYARVEDFASSIQY